MMLYLTLSTLGLGLVFLGLQVVWAWRLAVCYPHKAATAQSAVESPRQSPSFCPCVVRIRPCWIA